MRSLTAVNQPSTKSVRPSSRPSQSSASILNVRRDGPMIIVKAHSLETQYPPRDMWKSWKRHGPLKLSTLSLKSEGCFFATTDCHRLSSSVTESQRHATGGTCTLTAGSRAPRNHRPLPLANVGPPEPATDLRSTHEKQSRRLSRCTRQVQSSFLRPPDNFGREYHPRKCRQVRVGTSPTLEVTRDGVR